MSGRNIASTAEVETTNALAYVQPWRLRPRTPSVTVKDMAAAAGLPFVAWTTHTSDLAAPGAS
jgi:hypothetical protein